MFINSRHTTKTVMTVFKWDFSRIILYIKKFCSKKWHQANKIIKNWRQFIYHCVSYNSDVSGIYLLFSTNCCSIKQKICFQPRKKTFFKICDIVLSSTFHILPKTRRKITVTTQNSLCRNQTLRTFSWKYFYGYRFPNIPININF